MKRYSLIIAVTLILLSLSACSDCDINMKTPDMSIKVTAGESEKVFSGAELAKMEMVCVKAETVQDNGGNIIKTNYVFAGVALKDVFANIGIEYESYNKITFTSKNGEFKDFVQYDMANLFLVMGEKIEDIYVPLGDEHKPTRIIDVSHTSTEMWVGQLAAIKLDAA